MKLKESCGPETPKPPAFADTLPTGTVYKAKSGKTFMLARWIVNKTPYLLNIENGELQAFLLSKQDHLVDIIYPDATIILKGC